jgi:hypothetical protein
MGNTDALIALTMETSKPKDSDLTEKPERGEEFVHLCPGGILSEDPRGTGQFNRKRKKL